MSGVEGVERENFDDGEAGIGGFRILYPVLLTASFAS